MSCYSLVCSIPLLVAYHISIARLDDDNFNLAPIKRRERFRLVKMLNDSEPQGVSIIFGGSSGIWRNEDNDRVDQF